MMTIDAKQLWRQIAPEEKFEIMAQSHARGVLSAAVLILVMATIAVGLHLPWLLYSALIMSPLVFQMAAGHAWRAIKPRVMLEHLAVRSAARRFAFSHKSKDLGIVTVFRGEIIEQFDDNKIEEALSAMEEAVEKNIESAVWIALFNDAVIALSEHTGGAVLKMGHLIDKDLIVRSNSPSGKEYASDHEVILSFPDNLGQQHTYSITSKYPAALIVFEKKLKGLLAQAEKLALEGPVEAPEEEKEDPLEKMWGT